MPYNFVADSFHKRNFVADFLYAKCDFTRKTAVCIDKKKKQKKCSSVY